MIEGAAFEPAGGEVSGPARSGSRTSLIRPRHWGMPLFGLAVATVLGLGLLRQLLVSGYGVKPEVARLWMTAAMAERYRLVPYGLALLLTFLSYPRISDFKFTFLVVGASCLAAVEAMVGVPGLSGFERMIMGPIQSQPALVFGLVGSANLVLATLLPDVQRSSLTRELAVGVVAVELMALAAVSRALVPWLLDHHYVYGHPFPLGGYAIVLYGAAALLARWLVVSNYGLGGGIAGLALLSPAARALHGTSLDPAFAVAPGVFLLLTVLYVWSVRLRYRVSYDPLMQIYNRAHCDEILAEGPGAWAGRELAVAMIDVDHFKALNDRHGHAAGDAVLHAVAQAVRREGLPKGICCRYGGEEIILFLPDTPPAAAGRMVEHMRRVVEHLSVHHGQRAIKTTVSIGWTRAASSSDRPLAELVQEADRALYRAKADGRNRVVQA